MFDLEDYNYSLPQGSIAQFPASKRDHSRLLVVDRQENACLNRYFFDLPGLLKPGDLIVVNNTRVVPARIFGRKESGGRAELLVLSSANGTNGDHRTHTCFLKSSKRPKIGSRLIFDSDVTGEVREFLDNGLVSIRFSGDRPIDTLLEESGRMPLPPYIKRDPKGPDLKLDRERYQTVYSRQKGAVAAPTAGLHFTEDLIRSLEEQGISLAGLTLHVGYGTFLPVRTRDIREHVLGEEYYCVEPETAEAINKTKERGGRVVAVGTTVVRTLETAGAPDGSVIPGQGKTNLLITPGFPFKVVDALITNFHLPKSSLLFLVCAFAGLDRIKKAYEGAVHDGYRFFSYGDAMLIV
jgi:S-adenosylmethionine:tRNA ribosyltransferase-isomerase